MSELSPPTIIVVHPKERRSKCTVAPLRDRDGFVFWKYPHCEPSMLEGYLRLDLSGPELSAEDRNSGLLILDGTWRWTEKMEADYPDMPTRTLPANWQTAYPRTSKLFDNPRGGLATIEAIYAAYQILGRDTSGLLDEYHWADEFLQLNNTE